MCNTGCVGIHAPCEAGGAVLEWAESVSCTDGAKGS